MRVTGSRQYGVLNRNASLAASTLATGKSHSTKGIFSCSVNSLMVCRLIPGRVLVNVGVTTVPCSTMKKFAALVSVTFPARSKSNADASGSVRRASCSAR